MSETITYQTHSSDILEKSKEGVLTLTSKSTGCSPFSSAKEIKAIVIDPNTKIVTIKDRNIPFAEIEKIDCNFIHEQPSMEVYDYSAILKNGEVVTFCQLMIAAHDDTPGRISKIFNEAIVR